MRKSVFAAFAVVAVAAFSFVAAAADIPADKETIKLDLVAGKKGAVDLHHKKHVAEYKKKGGANIVCKDCHHTLAADDGGADKVKGCTDCHVKVGEAPKKIGDKTAPALAVAKGADVDQKTLIFHKQCVDGCHKEMKDEGKKIQVCKTCHKD